MSKVSPTSEDQREKAVNAMRDRMAHRIQAWPAEWMWAHGKPTPADFQQPPPWLSNVIRRLENKGPFKLLGELMPSVAGSATQQDIGKAHGLLEVIEAAFAHPPADIAQKEAQLPAIRELREKISAETQPLRDQAREAEKRLKEASVKSPQDVAEYHQGAGSGAQFVKGLDEGMLTIADELSGIFWMFWPEISTAQSRPEVYKWIVEERGLVACDWKTVEKFCREIEFNPAMQGS